MATNAEKVRCVINMRSEARRTQNLTRSVTDLAWERSHPPPTVVPDGNQGYPDPPPTVGPDGNQGYPDPPPTVGPDGNQGYPDPPPTVGSGGNQGNPDPPPTVVPGGNQGYPDPPSTVGPDGNQGYPDPPSTVGPDGNQGYPDPPSTVGPDGNQGYPDPPSTVGPDGNQGYPDPPSTVGPDGNQGYPDPPPTVGPDGNQGYPDPPPTVGPDGNQGYPDPPPTVGPDGNQGYPDPPPTVGPGGNQGYPDPPPTADWGDAACEACRSGRTRLRLPFSPAPTSLCLPVRAVVGVRGFTSGILSKLRPPKKNWITELSLLECGITDLEQDTFFAFPRLNHLYLDHNNLTHVKRTWFGGLMFPKSLITLSLSHNHINNIDPNCFQNLTLLGELLLDGNSLQNIQPFWFHGLRNLARLSLKSNSIESIHPQAFESLSWLRKLDLRGNALTCLPSNSMKALRQRLTHIQVSRNRMPPHDDIDPVPSVMTWHVDYRLQNSRPGPDISVRVDKELFCIIERYGKRDSVHIGINKLSSIDVSPNPACGREIAETVVGRYELPFVMISVNSDADKPHNVTHWCRHAWGDAGSVRVAVGRNLTLKIVPLAAGESNTPQIVAVVLSDVTAGVDRSRTSGESYNNRSIGATGHEGRKNVTCFLKAQDKMHRHVFRVPASGTSSGLVCEGKTTETQTTEESQTRPTTKVSLDQTSPYTTPAGTSPVQREERPLPGGVGIVPILTVVFAVLLAGVVLIALLIAACIIRKRCGSRDHQAAQAQGPPLAVISTSHWMISGANSRAVGVSQDTTSPVTTAGTAGQDSQSSAGDDPQYSRIPDEYFNYYNTRPWVQHPYWEIPDDYNDYYNTRPEVQHTYSEIPDRYYNYENTRRHSFPLTSSLHDDDEDDDDPVRFYAAGAEVVLPSSARQGGRHPGYGTAPPTAAARNTEYRTARQRQARVRQYGTLPRTRSDPRIPVRRRLTHVRPYGTLPRTRSDPQIPVRRRLAHVRPYGTLPRTRSDPRIPVGQRMAYVRQYGVSTTCRYRARDLDLIGKYGRPQGRDQRRTVYRNPAVNTLEARQRANVRYQPAHTLANKTRTNVSYQQAQHDPTGITESEDGVLTCEQGSEGRARRSKTLSTDMSKSRVKHSTAKANRRQSI
ncbi:hypothetical protein Bbelb_084990 [Branchiostoma belcheri]|nr:hypothetical protein Bbelb_084990 [Branchiostoma belcheri]